MKNAVLLLSVVILASCSAKTNTSKSITPAADPVRIESNTEGKGQVFTLFFYGGKELYYPLMAAWLEDSAGNYIQTLFVPESVATGVFDYGAMKDGKWVRAPKRAPQTLPYWAHKRGVVASDGLYMPDPENPVADAYSGATPVSDFVLTARADNRLHGIVRVMFEINQNWDWNDYWTNDKFPGNQNYLMSCQPALVYETVINADNRSVGNKMIPVGHSDPLGESGSLFSDLSTLTTALHIADSIIVNVSD